MTKTQTIVASASLMAWTFTAAFAEDPSKFTKWGENATDWTVDVAGWKPVTANEHPRLVFRKADIPNLKQRAATPEGKIIIARLEKILADKFTLWHPAGNGLLFVLTGDKKYADLAKEQTRQVLDRKLKDKDARYGFYDGGGDLRTGPSISAMGLAYDLNFDGWDPEFRQKVALAIQNHPGTAKIAARGPIGPSCNHFGAAVGGVGNGLLAIRGDTGTDARKVDGFLAGVVKQAREEIAIGHGDRGYYFEGHHCGRLSSNTGLIPFLQAYRVAAGKDMVSKSENARWIVAQWIYEFAANSDGKYTDGERGMYCRNFPRGGMPSEQSDFCQGFGICPPEFVPALKWVYNHQVEPGPQKTFDVLDYPHQAVYALANWPFDVPEKNPQDQPQLFPRVLHDKAAGYFVFRNGWSDAGNDIVVTLLIGSHPGSNGRGMAAGGNPYIYGKGLPCPGFGASPARNPGYMMPVAFHSSALTYSKFEADGSGVIACRQYPGYTDPKRLGKAGAVDVTQASSLAVDYSGASGAELLCAAVGPYVDWEVQYWMYVDKPHPGEVTGKDGYVTKTTPVMFPNNRKGYIVTLQKGAAPDVKEEGGKVHVGKRVVTFDGEKLILGN